MANATLKIEENYRDKLQLLSDKKAVSMKDFLQGMIKYFEETDIDPFSRDKIIPNEIARMRKEVNESLKETRNTIVGFIREQEKTKLLPLVERINEITEALFRFLKEDALCKSDLDALMHKFGASKVPQPTRPVLEGKLAFAELEVTAQDYERLLKRARDLFVDFLKKGKRSAFGGGIVFDNTIIEYYQNEFTKLKF